MTNLTPTEIHPGLTERRLLAVAELIRHARASCAALYEPERGDTAWDFGCRAYSWCCFAIRKETARFRWLDVIEDAGTLFVFSIDGVPLKFYRGDPEDPPDRCLKRRFPELSAVQGAFPFIEEQLDWMLRIAVEVDERGAADRITLVQVDEDGAPRGRFVIPMSLEVPFPTPFETLADPKEVPPPSVQPPAVTLKAYDDDGE